MGADSKIEWTHHTFNPWWGCARVSPGCEHCYAEAFAKRTGVKWGVQADRRFFGDKHWAEPLKWNAAARAKGERHRVFCASMADVFEDRADLNPERERLWMLIKDTPELDWLLLTKRPENARWMVPWMTVNPPTPWHNVWLGTTVEDQKRAVERIDYLLDIPATVRFLSCEPLLEQVDLSPWIAPHHDRIDWVIVGGESGHGARPCAIEWIEAMIRQCREAHVAVHVKQLGAVCVSEQRAERLDDGSFRWLWRAGLSDKKGGNWNDWPPHLCVREYPGVANV
jgi:protein gp37